MKRKAMKRGKDGRKFSKSAMKTHGKNNVIPRGGYRL